MSLNISSNVYIILKRSFRWLTGANYSQILNMYSTLSLCSFIVYPFLTKFLDFNFQIEAYLRIVHWIMSISTHAKEKKSLLQAPNSVTPTVNLLVIHCYPSTSETVASFVGNLTLWHFSKFSHNLASWNKKRKR